MTIQSTQLQGRRPFLTRTLVACALVAAGVVFGVPAASAAPDTGAAVGSACRPIDFTKAFVRALDTSPRELWLVVTGLKPSSNTEVLLLPVTYIRQPEYWEIQVLGCTRGLGLPVLTPYTASLPLNGTIGTKGVEVVGATRSLRIDVSPKVPVLDGQAAAP